MEQNAARARDPVRVTGARGQILVIFALSTSCWFHRRPGARRRRDVRPAARPADGRRPGGPGRRQRLPHQRRRGRGDRRAEAVATAERLRDGVGHDDTVGRRHRHVQRRRGHASTSTRRTATRFLRHRSACRLGPCRPSAAALAGFPDTASGGGPFIFSIGAFEDDGTPKYQTDTDFGETQRRRPDRRPGPRLDQLRDRQRQHAARSRDIIDGHDRRSTRRWTTASTSASTTTATTPRCSRTSTRT